MDAELEKLVEAGKLTTKSAGQLEKLKPGTFCLHKSWGFGRVREWNLLLNQIVIDFATKKFHPMQAQYAAENLTPLAPEHFLVRKAADMTTKKKEPDARRHAGQGFMRKAVRQSQIARRAEGTYTSQVRICSRKWTLN